MQKNQVTATFHSPSEDYTSNYILQQDLFHEETVAASGLMNLGLLWSACPVTHFGPDPLPKKRPHLEIKNIYLRTSLHIESSLGKEKKEAVKEGALTDRIGKNPVSGASMSQTYFLTWRKCRSIYEV